MSAEKKRQALEVKGKRVLAASIFMVALAILISSAFAAQDKYTVKAPNGVTFSEFKGYEAWQDVAPSQTDSGLKVILANSVMIDAYKAGIPSNGKHFPEGSKIAKIEWTKKSNPVSRYSVMVPDSLKSVSFIEKDSKRFPDTSGWGYAQFLYDQSSDTFKAYGDDSSFGKTVCYECHTDVKGKDYIFTDYARR